MSMTPEQMEIICTFYMENLSEDQLAELDARLQGDQEQIAADAAMRPLDKRSWLAMDSERRHATRQAKRTNRAQSEAGRAAMDAMFPHNNRIG